MENTPRLEETLLPVLSHPPTGWDRRPRHTLASTMVGLLPAGWSSLPAGGPAVERRAPDAQSTGRRLRRGLDQDQSERVALSGPLRPHAGAAWGAHGLSVARETSLGWQTSCRRRRSGSERGRAVPLGWEVRHPGSAPVRHQAAQDRRARAARLGPRGGPGGLLAERGWADPALRAPRRRRGGPGRLRMPTRFGRSRSGRPRWKGARLSGARGQACGWPQVSSTDQREGPGQRAGARPHQRTAWWDGRSEAPTAAPPCEAYGLRVASAETFFADTSNGCPLASARVRSAPARPRRCVVLALPPRSRVSPGTAGVPHGQRRLSAPHWWRGRSAVQSGWHGGQLALTRGAALLTHVHLSSAQAPEPAMASQRPSQR